MSKDLWRLSTVDLARRIGAREISCRDAAASCLARLEEANPRTNAVVEVLADEAMVAAAQADAALARGEPPGVRMACR